MTDTRSQMVRWAVREFFQCWKLAAWDMYAPRPGAWYVIAPWYVRLVECTWCAPLFAAEQSWAYFWLEPWRLPSWPMRLAHHLWYRLGGWCESRHLVFYWMAPDSGDPQEIGFHLREDLAKLGASNRMRIFLRHS